MKNYENLSTRELTQILVGVANEVKNLNPNEVSKPLLDKCNVMLRVAKHGIQIVALQTAVAKMKNLPAECLRKLPQIEVEDAQVVA